LERVVEWPAAAAAAAAGCLASGCGHGARGWSSAVAAAAGGSGLASSDGTRQQRQLTRSVIVSRLVWALVPAWSSKALSKHMVTSSPLSCAFSTSCRRSTSRRSACLRPGERSHCKQARCHLLSLVLWRAARPEVQCPLGRGGVQHASCGCAAAIYTVTETRQACCCGDCSSAKALQDAQRHW